MTSYTDLSGIFNVQKALLNDISSQLSNSNNVKVDTNLYKEVLKMQPDLDNYNQAFQQANESSAQVLDRQDDVIKILDSEMTRLSMKQQNVDNALEGKRRSSFLNDNYRERYSHYTKIVLIFVITLVIVYLLDSSKGFIPLPYFVINFIIAIIVIIAILLSYYNYMTILVRDKIYFDELNLPPPDLTNVSSSVSEIDARKNNKFALPGFGLCIDSDCCSDGTIWDDATFKCVVPSGNVAAAQVVNAGTKVSSAVANAVGLDGFTTLDMAYVKGDVISIIENSGNNKTGANTPNEFIDYTVYN